MVSMVCDELPFALLLAVSATEDCDDVCWACGTARRGDTRRGCCLVAQILCEIQLGRHGRYILVVKGGNPYVSHHH